MNRRFRKGIAILVTLTFLMQSVIFTSPAMFTVYADTEAQAVETVTDEGAGTGDATLENTEGEDAAEEQPAEQPAEEQEDGTADEQNSDPVIDTEEAIAVPAAPEEEAAEDETKAEPAKEAVKGPKTGTVLAFTSDVHNKSGNVAANRMDDWIKMVESKHGDIDVMAFGGDMSDANATATSFWTLAQADMDVVDQNGVTGVYTTGNHEHSPGRYSASSSDATQKAYKINTQGAEGTNYRIYCLGSVSSSSSYSSQIDSLRTYLNEEVGNDKPIFIITHFPLHYCPRGAYSERITTGASDVIDVLNNAVTNNGQKIVFLWGHNHTESDVYYDQIYKPGESIKIDRNGNTRDINFYYGAAGCMSDNEYGTGSESVKGKGLVVDIGSNNQLTFTYYNTVGTDVTEGGSYTEQPPVAITGATINETAPTVEAGKSVQLHYTVEPADATVANVTWSSSDTSVATVSQTGKVKGVNTGTATITATISDGITRGTAVASVDVNVTERTSQEQYYVIKINNYALSNRASSEMMSNSSGYVYHGLQTVTYDANAAAPHSILWTLEEAEGVENGYYIKDYNGDYLSATYVSNGQGYTGTLTVGETQDIWIVNGGLEAWQGNGSTLQSSNASTNAANNKAMYLGVTQSNNGIDFFTVRSTSDTSVPRTSTLVEPDEILEPIAVTGITLDPASLTLEAGKSAAVTANVLPENADDKTVEWSSSDESVATVNPDGRVRGVSAGTAVITATTNDGHKTATCEVTVTPSAAPGIGYVITITDEDGECYAMSSEPSSDVLTNSGSGSQEYHYTGLNGVLYDGTSEPTEEILWLFEPTEGGYYIMSQDGRYLNATYTANSTGGNDGVLKLDDTPDVWTLEGSLEDWVISGSTLKSTNSGKSITHEEGTTAAPLNLFTVRSTGESSSMVDPDTPAEVRFVETNALTTGRDYIVGVTASGNSIYAIENTSGTTSGDTGSRTLDVNPASGDESAYIVTDNTGVVWNYNSSRYLVNNTRYLSRGGSSGAYVPRASGSGSAVTYSSSNQRFSISYSSSGWGGGTTYYLTNSNGTFGFSTSTSSAAQVRLFEKQTVFNFKYVVQFVSNGENYQSSKYAAGETPVYGGETPTREETEQYTYTFSGWSSDGGATVYGPDEALPAIEGPVTYVAQFTAVPKPEEHTVTFETNGGGIVDPQSVADGATAEKPADPVKEGCFEFGGWFSDESLTEAFDFETAITGDITLYAKWNDKHTPGEAVRENEVAATCTAAGSYDEVVYCTVCGEELSRTPKTIEELGHDWEFTDFTWTGSDEAGWTAAVANYKCKNDPAHTTTAEATVTPVTTDPTCTADGKTVYTASVSAQQSIDETSHTDSKTVVIAATGHTPGEAVRENEVAATCTAAGSYDEVVYCTVCGEELSRTPKTIEELGHDWEFVDFTWTGSDEAGWTAAVANYKCKNDPAHTTTAEATVTPVTTDPTCTADGKTVYTASVSAQQSIDEASHTDSKAVVIAATGHTPGEAVRENEVAATCTAAGSYDEVVYCTVCGEELSRTPKTIEKLAHTEEVIPAVAPTCEHTGLTEGRKCSVCGEILVVQEVVDALGHDWEFVDFTWTGSDEAGWTAAAANYKCKNDPEHTTTAEATVTPVTTDPTCTADGKTVYTAAVSAQQSADEVSHTDSKTVVIAATGHIPGEAVRENEVAATCTAAGSYDEVVYCTVCGEELSRTPKTIDKLAHTEEVIPAVAPTCEHTGLTEGRKCSVCGEILVAPEVVDALGHDWNDPTYEWAEDNSTVTATMVCEHDAAHVVTETVNTTNVVTDPTCTEAGYTTYTAVFENEAFAKQTKKVDGAEATGHEWGAVTYTWSDDNSQVTAERVCANDESHKQIETINTTSVVTDPTCTEAGYTTYTAVFENEAFAKQTKKVDGDPATDHDWNTPTYEWAADNSTVTATRVCKNDATHTETETANTTSIVTAPTCTEAGYTTYTATFENEAFETQTNKVDGDPATGHKYGEPSYEWAEDNSKVTATMVCEHDATHVVTETANTTSVVTDPTCTDAGYTTYTAVFENEAFAKQTKKVDGDPATDHDWGAVTYTWSADNSQVTAERVCANDESHKQTETVNTTNVVKDPTCTEAGYTTYTATFTNTAFAEQTKKVDGDPATGHKYGEPSYEWEADNSKVTATMVCEHDATHVVTETVNTTNVVTAPTCTEAGYTTYTATFENEAFETQTNKVDGDPATGHKYGEPSYEWAADNSQVTATMVCEHDAAHVVTETANTTNVVTDPTCTEAGYTTYTAAFTNEAFTTQTKKVDGEAATGHKYGEPSYEWAADNSQVTATMVCEHDAAHVVTETVNTTNVVKDPTCTEAGYTTYTATFTNEAFTTQTKKVDGDPATDHDWGDVTYTWSADNSSVTAKRTCGVCGEEETETVGTTYAVITAQTETAAGLGRYTSAAFENGAFTVQTKDVVLQPTGYEVTYVWNETAGGYTVTGTAVPYAQGAETVTETVAATYAVTNAPTCEETGVGTWTTAAFESSQFSVQTKTVELEALGHTEEEIPAVAPTCTEPGKTAGKKCSVCGKILVAQEEIPATGHDWNAPTYVWADDHSSAVATFVCKNNAAHVELVNAAVTSVTTDPTCEADGKTVYTATAVIDGKEYTDSQEVVIPATGHDWNDPTYEWAEDYSTVTATRVCRNDATHTETETVETTYTVVKEATTTSTGIGRYTPKAFENEAFKASPKEVTIPKIAVKPAKVKNLWASQHDVGRVLFKWTGTTSVNPASWTVRYRTKKIEGGTWSGWTYKTFSGDTYQYWCPVKADYVVEIHAKSSEDTEYSRGIITTPAGGKYQAMKTVYVKNASTGKRITGDTITLKKGQTLKIAPDYEYPVSDFAKRPRLYWNQMLYDTHASNNYSGTESGSHSDIISITKSDGSVYTAGIATGTVTIKAMKAGTVILICRAPNGRTKVFTVKVTE